MKKIVLFYLSLVLLTINAKAIKVKFIVANTSVNVAEGSTGVFAAFQIHANDYINLDTVNTVNLINFPNIIFDNIKEVAIEKTRLNNKSDITFYKLTNSFRIINNTIYGKIEDKDIIQGNTYVYRISIITNGGQKINLINKSSTPQIANPKMNCAKLNNVYRLSGHNNFQESVISPGNGGFYRSMDFTRVIELDVHASNNLGTWNWSVRHIGSGNKNNCGYGTTGDKPFGYCIDDIKQWHLDHPNHDVIILFIDLKSDWNENNNNQTPADLDQRLLSLVPNADMIYKPRDLLGNNMSSNFGNMRLAAQQNNWPSMGDLTGKLMFVLTGEGADVSAYIADRSLDAVAFSAASVSSVNNVVNLPSIGVGLKNDIVFYNIQRKNISNGGGVFSSGNRYINRAWGHAVGWPLEFTNTQYAEAIDGDINNIAVKDVDGSYNPSNGKSVDGIQRPVRAENPLLDNSRIYSNYQNVTQAATQTITATNLIVEQGTHYRMIAGNNIKLKAGVHIQSGSDTKIRIDDCRGADYTLRKASTNQLTQEEIDVLMHELNKELYGYHPEDETEIVGLKVYPNPASNTINISYTNYLLKETIFTLYDLTGRIVETKKYAPSIEGQQIFSIAINSLKKGSYFYTLQVGEQNYNGKIVKMGF